MGKKAQNFRAWQYQNPHGTVKDAWNAAWEGQNALQYSLIIQAKNSEIERLHEQMQERDGVIEMILLRELRLREALSNLLAVTRQFLTDEPQKEAEKQAEAALAGDK